MTESVRTPAHDPAIEAAPRTCSFCGKRNTDQDVDWMVVQDVVAICSLCIKVCALIVLEAEVREFDDGYKVNFAGTRIEKNQSPITKEPFMSNIDPSDDPAVRAARAVDGWVAKNLSHSVHTMDIADIIRESYAPLLAAVRNLLAAINRDDERVLTVPAHEHRRSSDLVRACADAAEVVAKERELSEDRLAGERGVNANLKRQLAERDAELARLNYALLDAVRDLDLEAERHLGTALDLYNARIASLAQPPVKEPLCYRCECRKDQHRIGGACAGCGECSTFVTFVERPAQPSEPETAEMWHDHGYFRDGCKVDVLAYVAGKELKNQVGTPPSVKCPDSGQNLPPVVERRDGAAASAMPAASNQPSEPERCAAVPVCGRPSVEHCPCRDGCRECSCAQPFVICRKAHHDFVPPPSPQATAPFMPYDFEKADREMGEQATAPIDPQVREKVAVKLNEIGGMWRWGSLQPSARNQWYQYADDILAIITSAGEQGGRAE